MSNHPVLAIRPYRAADRDDVLRLNAYGLAAAGIDVDDDYYGGEDMAALDTPEDPYRPTAGGLLLVGEIAGQIVAMGALRRRSEDSCELLRMRVAPQHQRRGHGRAILAELEDAARRLGYRQVELITGEHQQAAVTLYRRHGYQVAERMILIGIASLRMTKRIGG